MTLPRKRPGVWRPTWGGRFGSPPGQPGPDSTFFATVASRRRGGHHGRDAGGGRTVHERPGGEWGSCCCTARGPRPECSTTAARLRRVPCPRCSTRRAGNWGRSRRWYPATWPAGSKRWAPEGTRPPADICRRDSARSRGLPAHPANALFIESPAQGSMTSGRRSSETWCPDGEIPVSTTWPTPTSDWSRRGPGVFLLGGDRPATGRLHPGTGGLITREDLAGTARMGGSDRGQLPWPDGADAAAQQRGHADSRDAEDSRGLRPGVLGTTRPSTSTC
ncbi:MAG: hypothetical protein Ct9H300mP1_31520 [Planctomycetaceae bacterium]|nr:MAG: hypothetical protein Ct9H300mP1_31520 [Planctomycetaceae bacterium]